MAVMIDRGLVRPRSQQLARGVSHGLRSVLVDVLSELEGLVGGREGIDVEFFDRDIGRGQALAEGPEQNVISLEVCDRLFEALRQAVDTDRLALLVAQVEWVDRDWRGGRWRPPAAAEGR